MSKQKGETYKHRLLLDELRSLHGIRNACNNIFTYAENNNLNHFNCDLDKLSLVADYVIDVTLKNYPDLKIPRHSRWRHLEAGGIDRLAAIINKQPGINGLKSAIELIIISSLLDAGAGMQWSYKDHVSKTVFNKSEGLAVALHNMYVTGIFSSDHHNLAQADPAGMLRLTEMILANGFQVASINPLVGVKGRLKILHALAKCVQSKTEYFALGNNAPRLGNILDYWLQQADNNTLSIQLVFNSLLDAFSEIWPGRYVLDGINLGDVWQHKLNVSSLNPDGYTPFHKLSQWVTYSLIEPLELANLTITDIDKLTGLPEYRNGGLFVDLGVLQAKHTTDLEIAHTVDSEFIVEWRAMTVALLDRLAILIRRKLNLNTEQLALSQILQGGTWTAGRKLAAELRSDAGPPFKIDSDGTVF